jgi:hypothetical protein
MSKQKIIWTLAACTLIATNACLSKQALEDAPIITSATHQHTLYNGRGQSIEAKTSKKDAPPVIVTYFHSEEDLYADRNGTSQAPVEVGNYFVRIRRPAGNGYRAGDDITVEFHIQKALITISAETRQEFIYDGNPKTIVFSVDQNVKPNIVYYHSSSDMPLNTPPIERGLYPVIISYNGDVHHMGASKRVELIIK